VNGPEGYAATEKLVRDAGWHRAASRARLLSWLSLAYMAAEGVTAAVLAGSVVLLGFGLDSAIEGLARCAYLAAAVLVGLLADTAFGWWWLGPMVGPGIAGLACYEGVEVWRGEECC
jgi:divalent metal cation (Fe/Co/Zn/Cd) transporter